MRLAQFIRENAPAITGEWEDFARTLVPDSSHMTSLALRDHIKEILKFVTTDMDQKQTSAEQMEKSRGEGDQTSELNPSPAETHAALRLTDGFDLDQMVSEYRALRASIIKLWIKNEHASDMSNLQDMIRFNEAIDQALIESISHYAEKLSDSKNLFLGILTHDLRNPLGAMMMSAQLIPKIGTINERQGVLIAQISDSGARISEIISHLLDITRARFGSGFPVVRSPMDLGFTARQLVDEMHAIHPQRKFSLEISGETEGNWDKARIGQVFSNLIGNAVQYSFLDSTIGVIIRGSPENVELSVHNEGIPIPPDKIGRIFDSLTRAMETGEGEQAVTTNLGLGLFITREIVVAHGGAIEVSSSEKGGTIFTATFPRTPPADEAPAAEIKSRRA